MIHLLINVKFIAPLVLLLASCAQPPGAPFVDPGIPLTGKPLSPGGYCECAVRGNCDPKVPVRCGKAP